MKKGILVLVVVVSLVAPVCGAQNWLTWSEYPDNPVLDPDSRAYYPCVVFDVEMFGGAGGSAPYKVWYQSETGIVHGYSFDGVDWVDVGQVAGLVLTAAHPWVLYDADGFGEGVFYKMWYWTGIGEVASINSIHYAESVDGLNWFNDQAVTQDGVFPLIDHVSGGWWYQLYGPACLIYTSDAVNLGGYPYDYSYVMLFDIASEGFTPFGIEAVGLAYSVDGKHWTRYGDEPVLLPSEGEWDGEYVTRGTLLELPYGGYGFWYSGGVTDSNDGVGYAESVDGLNWVKSSQNPIMHQDDTGYTGEPWRSDRTYTPMVVYDADKFSGYGDSALYKMWYSGRNPENSDYTVGVTYAVLQLPVGGSLEARNYGEIVLPMLVSALILVVVFVMRRGG